MKQAVPFFRRLAGFALIAFFLSSTVSSQVPAQTPAATPPTPQFDNRIFAKFDKLTHVKRVKTGDPVSAHLSAPAKLRDGTELPKGSKLVGTITDLKVKADKEGASKMGLLFTKVVLKDGSELPVRVALVTVAPPLREGEVDLLSAGNPFSGGNRMQAGTGSNTLNNSTTEGEALSRGLGARAPASKTNVVEGQMLPGKSYLPDVIMVSFSASNPGTILQSTAGSVYLDSGSRLLLLVQ